MLDERNIQVGIVSWGQVRQASFCGEMNPLYSMPFMALIRHHSPPCRAVPMSITQALRVASALSQSGFKLKFVASVLLLPMIAIKTTRRVTITAFPLTNKKKRPMA